MTGPGSSAIQRNIAVLRTDIANVRAELAWQSSDLTFLIITAVAGIFSIGMAVIGIMINMHHEDTPVAP